MVEVKADALEASFEALEREHEEVEALRGEVAALKSRMDAQAVVTARPALSGAKAEKSAFVESYLRKGLEAGVELKALAGTSDAAGGYAVPEEIDAAIDRTLTAISPIRAIANVVKVGSSGYRKLVTTGGTPSGWVAEDAERPETATPAFSEIAPPFGELYANPAASQAMLDDAAFDVEAWLASEIATEFARAEGAAFVSGSGVNRPKGFLTAPISAEADGVRPFGTLQFVTSGAAGGFAADEPEDRLIDLVQALRPPYRQGAVFVMNSATAARIRKFKTADGAFLWQPGLVAGQPDTLLGYPVIEAEDMPDIAMVAELMSAADVAVALGEAKMFMRVGHDGEDAVLEQMLLASAELCERFIDQALVTRAFVETLPRTGGWTRLGQRPVRAITLVEGVTTDGPTALPVGSYAIDIDAGGDGWVRAAGSGGRLRVSYEAGLAADWAGLPEALRQGVLKLTAHLFAERGGSGAPPAAVTALWRPWRRIPFGLTERRGTACSSN